MTEPRLISRKQAADYLGIGESTFSLWVATHKMPPAIAGTRKWDKRAIDARLDEISGLNTTQTEDRYQKWMRENSGETDLQKWRRERDARRTREGR
ncbi:helix-turn-helix transcriptional regulator [Rhizobium leguminosarum]|uniref:helix-turn-helix transcriptional regulator n=1 Tax=Rhizobium leguminosarum TaxID=384 RepID=UPI001C97CF51|nr:helix-turn-helix domain-containing protein [Rhizobium leguminosarum]MBY5349566.1 helix-turn-helix domain-containing protein [Rhizobium leguminosarum]